MAFLFLFKGVLLSDIDASLLGTVRVRSLVSYSLLAGDLLWRRRFDSPFFSVSCVVASFQMKNHRAGYDSLVAVASGGEAREVAHRKLREVAQRGCRGR